MYVRNAVNQEKRFTNLLRCLKLMQKNMIVNTMTGMAKTLQAFHRGNIISKNRAASKEKAKEMFPGDKKKQQEYIKWIHDHNIGKTEGFLWMVGLRL